MYRHFLFCFAGGGILTILLGPLFGYLLMQSPNLICPTSQLTVRDCDPYSLPLFAGKRTLHYLSVANPDPVLF
jgi:hypothetical protein